MSKSTLEKVSTLVRIQLGVRNVNGADRFMEDLGAESVDLVNIIAAAETAFDVTFDEDHLPGVRTVNDLCRLIDQAG